MGMARTGLCKIDGTMRVRQGVNSDQKLSLVIRQFSTLQFSRGAATSASKRLSISPVFTHAVWKA